MRGIGLSFSLFPVRIDSSLLILWMGGDCSFFFLIFPHITPVLHSTPSVRACSGQISLSPSSYFRLLVVRIIFPIQSKLARLPFSFCFVVFFFYYFLKCSNKKKPKTKTKQKKVILGMLCVILSSFCRRFSLQEETKKKEMWLNDIHFVSIHPLNNQLPQRQKTRVADEAL